MSDLLNDPEERTYKMRCLIKNIVQSVQDASGKNYESKLTLLIPQESDERTKFLIAHLPDDQEDRLELAGYLPPPFDTPIKVSVHRGPDKKSERHYLHLMSTGVIKIMHNLKMDGKTALVTILPVSEIEAADGAREDDQSNYEVMK